MSRAVVVTETLGGSPLSRAARRGELSPRWYPAPPRTPEAWTAYLRGVAGSVAPTWLDDLRAAMAPSGAAAARLERVVSGGGCVVTTGQQPGLFGGPVMTFIKALSARALADVLERETGVPVAPVFWAATDDADFDEAAVVSIVGERGAEELRLARVAAAGTPMAHTPIGSDVARLAHQLRSASGSVPHPAVLEAAISDFRAGATVGGAYVSLLRNVLEPLGIAVLDASHSAVGAKGAPLFQRALERGEAVATGLRERGDEIRKAGFSPQVEEVAGLSLVFTNEGAKRRLPVAEAGDRLRRRDPSLSATVLLRPVLERVILPTAAYMAGPGEFAYFAQVSAVAEALSSPVPLCLPRWSATIIESRVQRLLGELGITYDAVRDPAALEGRIARERLPSEVAGALAALRGAVTASVDALSRANGTLVTDAVIDGARHSMLHRVERIERRFAAAVKRRESDVMRCIGLLSGALYPYGAPQERALSFVPFLARYGSELVDEMLAQAGAHARAIAGDARQVAELRETPVPARR